MFDWGWACLYTILYLQVYSEETRLISFATTSFKVIIFGSPIKPFARCAYSVPPSVQIRRSVTTVAAGFPASHAADSNSRKRVSDGFDTDSHGWPEV